MDADLDTLATALYVRVDDWLKAEPERARRPLTGISPQLSDAEAREAERAHELAGQGHLLRLWALGKGRALGLWRAQDAAEMQAILKSLPLDDWMTVQTTPLSQHPGDRALTKT